METVMALFYSSQLYTKCKIHVISTATVKWQTKLVLLWIVNGGAAQTPSAVYITTHVTGYKTFGQNKRKI